MVSGMVGLPDRQLAIVEYSCSNLGRYGSAVVRAHAGVTLDQSARVDVASAKRLPHGVSEFSVIVLWAIPTMTASAARSDDSNTSDSSSSSSSMGGVKLLCWDRLSVSTFRPVPSARAVAYRSTNPVQPGQSSGLLKGMESPMATRRSAVSASAVPVDGAPVALEE